MARNLSPKEALQRAGRFCALRERSPQETLDKVKSWGLSEREAKEVLKSLVESGFINEQRFVNAYCHDKFEFNSWGKQKIRASLFPHKISVQLLEEALNRIDTEKYESRLRDLAMKKWTRLNNEEGYIKKQKTASYLAGKGFELDLIWKAIHSISEKGH